MGWVMTFWDWVYRLGPGWPRLTERQGYTIGMFALVSVMLFMAQGQPTLWDVKLFEVILQALVLTGLLNLAGAFHFAANKQGETATENTGKMADAIRATAEAQKPVDGDAGTAAQVVADAAQEEADAIKRD